MHVLVTQLARRLLARASGRVLVVGAGRVFRHTLDERRIESVIVSDASLHAMQAHMRAPGSRGSGLVASGDHLPFKDETFDTVVATFVFCSVLSRRPFVAELARVLTWGGSLLFMEHTIQRVTPLHRLLGRTVPRTPGCRWNSRFDPATEFSGTSLELRSLRTDLALAWPGPRIVSGVAEKVY